MVKLPQITFTSALATILLGLVTIQLVTWGLFSIGIIKQEIKLGIVFLFLEVAAVISALFVIVIKKQLTLDNRDLIGLVILIAVTVASFILLPQLLPPFFDSSLITNWHNITFSALGMNP